MAIYFVFFCSLERFRVYFHMQNSSRKNETIQVKIALKTRLLKRFMRENKIPIQQQLSIHTQRKPFKMKIPTYSKVPRKKHKTKLFEKRKMCITSISHVPRHINKNAKYSMITVNQSEELEAHAHDKHIFL